MRNKLVGIFHSLNNIPNTLHRFSSVTPTGNNRGFTIVELLIVVVIIGILAAIVVVAYNGINNKAKTSSAQSTQAAIRKKMELYATETGSYPATYSVLTGAASTTSYYIPSTAYTIKATALASTDTEKTFNYASCVTPTGVRLTVWDYTAGNAVQTYFGGASASSTCTLVTS